MPLSVRGDVLQDLPTPFFHNSLNLMVIYLLNSEINNDGVD